MGSNNRLGQLNVSDRDQNFTDIVIVTAFVLQRSTDARKRDVTSFVIETLTVPAIGGLVKGTSLCRDELRLEILSRG